MGGKFDSSKTRVRPVFDILWSQGRDWLPQLLTLPVCGYANADEFHAKDLTLLDEGDWEPEEKRLLPPVSLLSWLIRHPTYLAHQGKEIENEYRRKLLAGDPDTVTLALRLLRTEGADRNWYIFEGPTCPDVFLVARDALVVIEGKRTERVPTVKTTWLQGRHQIWRHLDAAWEIRGRRSVYGFLIVDSEADSLDGSVPEVWRQAARECLQPSVLSTSFPHRSADEMASISRCFLGATTWQQICARFCIDLRSLPDEV